MRTIIYFFLVISFNVNAGLLFEENFDAQEDWKPGALIENSDSLSFAGIVLNGWSYYLTHELWNPDFGEPFSQPSLAINGNNSEQIYGGKGKALIKYNESALTQSNDFASDGFLTIDIKPSNAVYVEFKIKFQPGFTNNFPPPAIVDQQFLLKLVRILHYDGVGSRSKFFSIGNSAPIYIYDYGFNNFGVRNLHTLRCDSQETNYKCKDPQIIDDYPRSAASSNLSANYSSDIYAYNPDNMLPDLVNGGSLPKSGNVLHDQVWGNKWHKIALYVRLNSAKGVQDGVIMQWMDDKLIVELRKIPWIGNSGDINAKWNSVSFGGNAHFHFNLDENASKDSRERWYAIDDIKIYDAIPNAPKPPFSLKLQ